MKITALEEYGLRCMLFLAKHEDQTALTLPEISAHEGFSIAYAGKLLMILKHSALVRSVRGRNGGYILAKSADKIFLKEIFDCLGESVFTREYCDRHSGENDSCVHQGNCGVQKMWMGIDRFISGIFNKITLADMASGNVNSWEIIMAGSNAASGISSNDGTLSINGS